MSNTDNIKNDALLLIGANAEDGFTNTDIDVVKAINSCFETQKAKLFSLHDWTFNEKRAAIDAIKDEDGSFVENEDDYYKYQFCTPCDCLKIRTINKEKDSPVFFKEYTTREDKIIANYTRLYLCYTYPVPDNLLPPPFGDLLSNAIAAEICFKLTGNKVQQQILYTKTWGNPSENLKGGLFGFYSKADASQRPSRRLCSKPLVFARWQRVGG